MSTTTPGRTYDGSKKGMVALGTAGFAGVMLSIVAVFQILEGIAALAGDTVYVTGIDYTYEFDVTAWGWIHLVIGILGLATGIGILAGQTWGMLAGIGIAAIAAMSNFAFLPYYPFWALVILAFNVFIIWALCHRIAAGDGS